MPFRFRHRGRSVPAQPPHPRRALIHEHADFGARAADAIAARLGSWHFIIAQTIIIVIWVALNVTALVAHWDPYPFILLNLMFSTQAAYAAPIIVMAQNRQAAKDRIKLDIEAQEVEETHAMGKTQLRILARQDEVLDAVHDLTRALHDHIMQDTREERRDGNGRD